MKTIKLNGIFPLDEDVIGYNVTFNGDDYIIGYNVMRGYATIRKDGHPLIGTYDMTFELSPAGVPYYNRPVALKECLATYSFTY